MIAGWVENETATADFNDRRLNKRFQQIVSALSEHPVASIPAACGGHAETTAAYRFFDNDAVTYSQILQPHVDATLQRIAAQEVVLLVNDTTELDLARPRQQVEGAGPMDGSARRGAFMHVLEAFTPDGTPLGTVDAHIWARDEESALLSQAEKRKTRKAAPIEEKESFRWLEGLRRAREVAQMAPSVQCIYIADSESDIYHLFAEPRGQHPVDWIIRACQDRCASLVSPREQEEQEQEEVVSKTIRQVVLSQPVLFTKQITVRGRQTKVTCEARSRRTSRESRTADMEVRAARVMLRPPTRSLPAVELNVVMVREPNAPPDHEPVEWILLTTMPIDTVEQVRRIVAYYAVRWMIEILFRTLKSGCRVEERRFEHLDRILPCVAVYLIVAWRTLMLVRLGRSCPEMNCEAMFEPSEWKSVWMVIHREPPPSQSPLLGEFLRLIGQLGGYINRPGRTDMPGPQTTWLGLQRMRDLAWAWDTFGPGAKNKARDV